MAIHTPLLANIAARSAMAPHWVHRAVAFGATIAILGVLPTLVLNQAGSGWTAATGQPGTVVAHSRVREDRGASIPGEPYFVIVVSNESQAGQLRDSLTAAASLESVMTMVPMAFEIVILADDRNVEALRVRFEEGGALLASLGREVTLIDARRA